MSLSQVTEKDSIDESKFRGRDLEELGEP